MKLLVCGGRGYNNRSAVYSALDRVNGKVHVTLLIHGDARGADRLGRDWAICRGVPHKSFPADWKKHGKKAGPIRNQQMLDEGKPDGVVAFPGGSGTADMIARATAAGVKVWRPYG